MPDQTELLEAGDSADDGIVAEPAAYAAPKGEALLVAIDSRPHAHGGSKSPFGTARIGELGTQKSALGNGHRRANDRLLRRTGCLRIRLRRGRRRIGQEEPEQQQALHAGETAAGRGRPQSAPDESPEKRRPAARFIARRGICASKNSGSDLLSHMETMQYHRLWRA